MLLSFAWAYLGFTALSLAKNRHYQQVWPGKKLSASAESILSTLGWVLLAFSSYPIFYAEKISVAWVDWFGVLSVAALLLVLQFSYLPRTVSASAGLDALVKLANAWAAKRSRL